MDYRGTEDTSLLLAPFCLPPILTKNSAASDGVPIFFGAYVLYYAEEGAK